MGVITDRTATVPIVDMIEFLSPLRKAGFSRMTVRKFPRKSLVGKAKSVFVISSLDLSE